VQFVRTKSASTNTEKFEVRQKRHGPRDKVKILIASALSDEKYERSRWRFLSLWFEICIHAVSDHVDLLRRAYSDNVDEIVSGRFGDAYDCLCRAYRRELLRRM